MYILEILRAYLIERNNDGLLARLFGIEKTLELLTRKYYQSKIRFGIEKYDKVMIIST